MNEECEGSVLVIGHLTVDDIVLPTGETAMETPGGNALYASLGMLAWGMRPQLITVQPREYPSRILGVLTTAGVDTQFLQSIEVPGVRQWALYDGRGGRQYHPQRGSSNYEEITPRPSWATRLPRHVAAAHVAPMPVVHQLQWVRWLKAQGCPCICLDPHEDQLQNRDLWHEILAEITVFLPSEIEVVALLGPNISAREAARQLADLGPRIVVVKRGVHGSVWYDRERQVDGEVPPVAVNPTDPTGCGDAYCGGFLAGLVRTGEPESAAQWGAVSASFVLEGYGPSGALQVRTVEAIDRLAWYQTYLGGKETM